MATKDDPYIVLKVAREAWDKDPAFRAAWDIFGPATREDATTAKYDLSDERDWEQLLLDVVEAVKAASDQSYHRAATKPPGRRF